MNNTLPVIRFQWFGYHDTNGGLIMKKPERKLENKQLRKVNPKLSKYGAVSRKRAKFI
jgi:hypothetical protein